MGVKLTQYQVVQKCKTFAKAIWGVDFNLPVDISGRMTRRFGYFQYYKSPMRAIKLQFAARLIAGDYNEETIDSVIKHELCHWYIFTIGGNFHDGDYQFETELKRIGAHATKVINSAGELHTCTCSKCGKLVYRGKEKQARKYASQSRYTSKCCHAKIVYIGSQYFEDKTQVVVPRDQELAAAFHQMKQDKAPVKQAASEPAPSANQTTKHEDVIEVGRRGVTNAQMIPALKKAVSKNAGYDLIYLKTAYNSVFISSLKYLPPKMQDRINELMGK